MLPNIHRWYGACGQLRLLLLKLLLPCLLWLLW